MLPSEVDEGLPMSSRTIITNTDTTVDKMYNGNAISCIYDRNSNPQRTCNGYASVAPAGEYWISDKFNAPTEAEAQNKTGSVCNTDLCISNDDYYEAAKRKCIQSGGHLATLAELEIARINEKLTNDSAAFWSSEESTSYYAYYMRGTGFVNHLHKPTANAKFICIGNN